MNEETSEHGARDPRTSERAGRRPGATRVRGWIRDLLIVVAVYFAVSLYQTRGTLGASAPFPAVELKSLDGETVTLSAYRGRPVMVHAWATWCAVCRREFGSVAAVAEAPPGEAAVVTIVMDGENAEQIRAFVREHHIAYPVLLGNDAVAEQLGVSVFPTTYYLDRRGEVSSVTAGMSLRWAMWLRLWWAG